MSPCAPKGFSNYLRQIYAFLTFSYKDWMPRTNFGVCNVFPGKWGRYGPLKLGKIWGKMKKAEKKYKGVTRNSLAGAVGNTWGYVQFRSTTDPPPLPQKFLGGIEVDISAPKPFSKSLRQIFAF